MDLSSRVTICSCSFFLRINSIWIFWSSGIWLWISHRINTWCIYFWLIFICSSRWIYLWLSRCLSWSLRCEVWCGESSFYIFRSGSYVHVCTLNCYGTSSLIPPFSVICHLIDRYVVQDLFSFIFSLLFWDLDLVPFGMRKIIVAGHILNPSPGRYLRWYYSDIFLK